VQQLNINSVCAPSKDIVAREIGGDLLIIPLVAGIGDAEDELFTLNETGKAIWDRLDGRRELKAVAEELAIEYQGDLDQITKDVLGLVAELVRRKMLVEIISIPAV
jgi:hypothetical protein